MPGELKAKHINRLGLYDKHLRKIHDINFTLREIDIIACSMYNTDEKKVAELLFISPITVSSHTNNIILKIGGSSKESLVNFLKNSGKLLFIREYYSHLLMENAFKEHLIKLGKLLSNKELCYKTSPNEIDPAESTILKKIKQHLKLLQINETKDGSYNLYILNKKPPSEPNPNNISLLLKKNLNTDEFNKVGYIDFTKPEEYYKSFCKLMKKIINAPEVLQTISDIKNSFELIMNSWSSVKNNTAPVPVIIEKNTKINLRLISLIIVFSILLSVVSAPWITKQLRKVCGETITNIDSPPPEKQKNLKRISTLKELKYKLSKKQGIKTIALVGIGGSGKTTIARQYAHNERASLTWEINTETRNTIITSLQQLAYASCNSDSEREEIHQIQNLTNIDERERRIFIFLRKTIKRYSNWLLIYDQVQNLRDVIKYFPNDKKTWGDGRIIITTNNTNIAHSHYVPNENLIYIPELSESEKFQLFADITNHNKQIPKHLEQSYKKCLKNIPPFPLDISIAAHYIKETQISCDKYLQYNPMLQKNFLSAQKTILKDIGEYTKTRYDIITLSIKHIIETSSDFKDLLFFTSMLNYKSIPKNLLYYFKDEVVADSFLHELNKFSITTKKATSSNASFSIHSSTQNIIATYFLNSPQITKPHKRIHSMIKALEKYMSYEIKNYDLNKIQGLIPHVEMFLSHDVLFDKFEKAALNKKLGVCYFYIANYAKAKNFLKKTLNIYKKYYGKRHIKTARIIARLGAVERNSGNYKQAQELFEKSLLIYKKHYGENHKKTAWAYVYLGSIYRNIGLYDKAIDLINNGYEIYKKNYSHEPIKTACAAAYLASIYKDIGDCQKAEILLEKSLESYKKYYGEHHTKTAWVSVRLASVYRCTGKYDKALELINSAIVTYKENNPEDCLENAWTMGHLGVIYYKMGDEKKSEELLLKSIALYEKKLNPDNIVIAWAKYHLGKLYAKQNKYDLSQEILEESLKSHKRHYGPNNIKTAFVLLRLSETLAATNQKEKARKLLISALVILENHKHPGKEKVFKLLKKL